MGISHHFRCWRGWLLGHAGEMHREEDGLPDARSAGYRRYVLERQYGDEEQQAGFADQTGE
jgi:hypothetical protein